MLDAFPDTRINIDLKDQNGFTNKGIEAAHADTDADEERDPGRLFLRLLGEALIGQDCHVATDAGKIPDELEPTACGWRPGFGDGVFMPGGVRIGYVRTHPKTGELRLMLLPKAAAPVAAKAAEQAGIQLGLTVPGISQALEVAEDKSRGLVASVKLDACASIATAREVLGRFPFPFSVN